MADVTWKDLICTPMALTGAVGYLAGAICVAFPLPSNAQRILGSISLLCLGISHRLAYLATPGEVKPTTPKGPPS